MIDYKRLTEIDKEIEDLTAKLASLSDNRTYFTTISIRQDMYLSSFEINSADNFTVKNVLVGVIRDALQTEIDTLTEEKQKLLGESKRKHWNWRIWK